jgi:Raf kinase inhibitor-like YbhB/YbcL family protein
MQLTSPAFQTNTPLPDKYTCRGDGVSPPLQISDVPDGTQSLVLMMHDPDAIGGKDFLHWSVWNITPDTTEIAENSVPNGAVQGLNDYPTQQYGPACPPAGTGTHHYVLDLYALDVPLPLTTGTAREELELAMREHILAQAQLVGIVRS